MIAGSKYYGLMSDLWSCGVVLYAMLCGYLPYEVKDFIVLKYAIGPKDIQSVQENIECWIYITQVSIRGCQGFLLQVVCNWSWEKDYNGGHQKTSLVSVVSAWKLKFR